MRAAKIVLALFAPIALALACAHAPAVRTAGAGGIEHVIIITVDGLMPVAYLDPDAHGLRVPTLRKMAAAGTLADPGATTVFPSVTYPAHTSIATGVNPGRHGIVTNLAADPEVKNAEGWRWYRQDVKVPTLYDAAYTAGMRTALIDWPVTVGAIATDLIPEYWRAGTIDDPKLSRALSTPGFFAAVEKEFPDFDSLFTPPKVKDAATVDAVLTAMRRDAPALTFAHVWQTDDAQHDDGPWSPPAIAAIENADAQIARLIAGLQALGVWDSTVIVLASDHGFAPITKAFRPRVVLAHEGLVALDAEGKVTDYKAYIVTSGSFAYVYVRDPADAATRTTLVNHFAEIAARTEPPIAHVWKPDEIVAAGGDPTAILAFEASPGYGLLGGFTGDLVVPSKQRGTHGYDPLRPEMRASLIFYGPPVAAGRLTEARLIDIAPTVAGWLGLDMPGVEGHALPVKLRKN